MKYVQPTLVLIGPALVNVATIDKEPQTHVDSLLRGFTTNAYEADE